MIICILFIVIFLFFLVQHTCCFALGCIPLRVSLDFVLYDIIAEWNDVNCGNTIEMSMWPSQWIARVDELNKLASLQYMGLHNSAGRALHC